jgi:hypothetical protein
MIILLNALYHGVHKQVRHITKTLVEIPASRPLPTMVTAYGNGPSGLDSDDKDPHYSERRGANAPVQWNHESFPHQSIHRPAANPRARMHSGNSYSSIRVTGISCQSR